MDLSVDLNASSGDTMVLTITGGSITSTPEFTPGRTGGTLTGLGGQVTCNLSNGAATASFTGSFSDPAFSTTIVNQSLTGAPGASTVVLRPSFGSSGNSYVDDVLTPIVAASADEIVLIEFTGTTTGVAAS